MDITLTQTIAAIVMVGLGLALIVAYRTYLASNSERRMLSMLDSLGLDSEIASSGPKPPGFKAPLSENGTFMGSWSEFLRVISKKNKSVPISQTVAAVLNPPQQWAP